MESLTTRLIYTVLEAACAATGIAAFIVLVRKLQIAFGVKDDTTPNRLPSVTVR